MKTNRAPVVIAPDFLRRMAAAGDEDAESVTRNVNQLAANAVTAFAHLFANDYEASLDGKPSKVTGSPAIDELSLKRVNEHTIDATGKKDGKVVYTDKRTVSKDGKTYTISRTGTSPDGKKYQSTMILDRVK